MGSEVVATQCSGRESRPVWIGQLLANLAWSVIGRFGLVGYWPVWLGLAWSVISQFGLVGYRPV